jgi:hypothetical protein
LHLIAHGKFLSVLMPNGPCANATWGFPNSKVAVLIVALIILLDAQVRSFQMAMAWCMMALRVTAHFDIQKGKRT